MGKKSTTKRPSKAKKGYSMPWHTRNEKSIAKAFGASVHHPGHDGTIRGKPYEVREAKRSNVFRIQKNVHNTLCRRSGFYIFKNGDKIKMMDANKITGLMKRRRWNHDRKYPYKFLKTKDVFPS